MRTTLTLDDDVAAQLRKLERTQDRSFKEIVNAALRLGLSELERGKTRSRTRFRTKPLKLGACRVGSIDDVSEVLAIAEGELYR
jgi:hypothetical protein